MKANMRMVASATNSASDALRSRKSASKGTPTGLLVSAAALALSLTGCIPSPPKPAPAPQPTSAPVPRPQPQPTTPPAPVAPPTDWRDAPQSAGDWSLGRASEGTTARFAASFELRCNAASRTMTLVRLLPAGSPAATGSMAVTTMQGTRTLAAQSIAGGLAVTLPARDPLLDAMAFSRGRFAVATSGQPTLYLPSWTEISRVIEDCR
ncbi:hypothetical protein I5E68_06490 [Novosphingobium sp. YJ-S2-02]|uniref:Uncharacterized protein n=2 Tax=Novosphingobium aureum TaxID=2792964 RepID=A0A931MKL9_9SPHN|nr:hypothetical protein [Novosphingobium aureum]